jgi:hypothetical protein
VPPTGFGTAAQRRQDFTLGLDAELAILRFSNPAQAADALNCRLIAAFVD